MSFRPIDFRRLFAISSSKNKRSKPSATLTLAFSVAPDGQSFFVLHNIQGDEEDQSELRNAQKCAKDEVARHLAAECRKMRNDYLTGESALRFQSRLRALEGFSYPRAGRRSDEPELCSFLSDLLFSKTDELLHSEIAIEVLPLDKFRQTFPEDEDCKNMSKATLEHGKWWKDSGGKKPMEPTWDIETHSTIPPTIYCSVQVRMASDDQDGVPHRAMAFYMAQGSKDLSTILEQKVHPPSVWQELQQAFPKTGTDANAIAGKLEMILRDQMSQGSIPFRIETLDIQDFRSLSDRSSFMDKELARLTDDDPAVGDEAAILAADGGTVHSSRILRIYDTKMCGAVRSLSWTAWKG